MKQRLTYSLTIIGVALLLGFSIFLAAQPAIARNQRFQGERQSGVTEPAAGDTISGIVVVRGTAAHENFLRYELAFNSGGDWIVFAEGTQPVVEGTLAIWDTTVGRPTAPVFPDGTYRLRLRVVRQDYNYDEYVVRDLLLANQEITPTPELTATVATGTPTPAVEAATPDSTRPPLLPSLTPFPTPSPEATVASVIFPGESADGSPDATGDERQGLFQQLLALDTTGLSAAFWQGARLAVLPFAMLAFYLLVRGAMRRLWRTFWGRLQDGRQHDRRG